MRVVLIEPAETVIQSSMRRLMYTFMSRIVAAVTVTNHPMMISSARLNGGILRCVGIDSEPLGHFHKLAR
jgi:hypothetical protein